MDVTLVRTGERRNRCVCVRPDGSVVQFWVYDYSPAVDHDVVHLAVESVLGLRFGFWGLLAAGAPFEALSAVERGTDVGGDGGLLAEHRASLLEAEGLTVDRSGLSPEQQAACDAAIASLHAQWSAVPVGGRLHLTFPVDFGTFSMEERS